MDPAWIKMRHSSISSTRKNYTALTRAIFGDEGIWVNTNIYPHTAARQFQLTKQQKVVDKENLVWLVQNCADAIIVTYGNEACSEYRDLWKEYPGMPLNIRSSHLTDMQIRKKDPDGVSGYEKLKRAIFDSLSFGGSSRASSRK